MTIENSLIISINTSYISNISLNPRVPSHDISYNNSLDIDVELVKKFICNSLSETVVLSHYDFETPGFIEILDQDKNSCSFFFVDANGDILICEGWIDDSDDIDMFYYEFYYVGTLNGLTTIVELLQLPIYDILGGKICTVIGHPDIVKLFKATFQDMDPL